MKKEYDRLTAEQFRRYVQFIPELLSSLNEMNVELSTLPDSTFDSVMTAEYGLYSHVYELPFTQHLGLLIKALNRVNEVQEWAGCPDPQEAVLEMLENQAKIEDKPHHTDFQAKDVVALMYSVGRSIQSMVTYGQSVSSLLNDVRENNNHKSLMKAIRMDRSVVGCPTAMKLIARAQIRDDQAFFKDIRMALVGPSKRQWAALGQMRYAFLILREMGMSGLSETELEALMVDKLQVYKGASGDARKNLRAHYLKFRKLQTI